ARRPRLGLRAGRRRPHLADPTARPGRRRVALLSAGLRQAAPAPSPGTVRPSPASQLARRTGPLLPALVGALDQRLPRAPAGLRPKHLLLDRGFYAAPVIAALQRRGVAFVMPMIRRGKKAEGDFAGTGTQPFFRPGRYGWARHTWEARPRRGGRRGPALTV